MELWKVETSTVDGHQILRRYTTFWFPRYSSRVASLRRELIILRATVADTTTHFSGHIASQTQPHRLVGQLLTNSYYVEGLAIIHIMEDTMQPTLRSRAYLARGLAVPPVSLTCLTTGPIAGMHHITGPTLYDLIMHVSSPLL
jgi:hypothetical protein